MSKTRSLPDLLASYTPYGAEDAAVCQRMRDLYAASGDASLYRNHLPPIAEGHFTGSALVVSDDNGVLLNHHKFLQSWLCFGGHADGEGDIRSVALREALEESGLKEATLSFVTHAPFDLDIHAIPANPNKGEPAHAHFDICFLLQTSGRPEPALSDESDAVRWFDIDAAHAMLTDVRMQRMLGRWQMMQSRCGAA